MKQAQLLNSKATSEFKRDGFLKLPHFFTESECDALRIRILELIARNEDGSQTEFRTDRNHHTSDEYFLHSGDKIRFFFEKNASQYRSEFSLGKARLINKVGHALHDLDPVFKKFSRLPKLKQLSLDLGIQRALLLQSMYIFKQPQIGGEVDCHQDGTFLASNPDSVIGLWIALEDATVDNGCLYAIPGGHLGALRSRFIRMGDTTRFIDLSDQKFELGDMVPLDIKKGGLIVLHSLLPHMSHENKSHKSRHAYTLHIMDAKSHYMEDNWLTRPKNLPFRDFDDL